MNLRIISGKFGGRTIAAPDGDLTHPMGERVRGSLFNIINSRIKDADVLDAFAGTGSLGLESISRGAKSAIFIERDRVASRILAENINKLGVKHLVKSVQIGVATWIDKNQDKKFDIIFVDPPYNDMQFLSVDRLGLLLKTNGLLILSYPSKTNLPIFKNMNMMECRNFGNANLAFFVSPSKLYSSNT